MTVTKAEMAHYLVDEMGLTYLTSLDLVNSLFDTIRETLAYGEDVKLSGFGNFRYGINLPDQDGIQKRYPL